VSNTSLQDIIDRAQPLLFNDACSLAVDVITALGHLHHKRICHNNVNTRTILVTDNVCMIAYSNGKANYNYVLWYGVMWCCTLDRRNVVAYIYTCTMYNTKMIVPRLNSGLLQKRCKRAFYLIQAIFTVPYQTFALKVFVRMHYHIWSVLPYLITRKILFL